MTFSAAELGLGSVTDGAHTGMQLCQGAALCSAQQGWEHDLLVRGRRQKEKSL